MPGLFFGFCLRLRQSTFHKIGVISGIGRNWNRSDSAYDSDFRFSLVRSPYDSDYDPDSVASENQPYGMCVFHFHGHLHPGRIQAERSRTSRKSKWNAHFPFGYFGWEIWTTSEDVSFIWEIFRSGKQKPPFHLHTNRNFRTFLVNGKHSGLHYSAHVHESKYCTFFRLCCSLYADKLI